MNRIYKCATLLTALFVLAFAPRTLAATFTVGPGGDFPDLAAAVADINNAPITGPVIFDIIPGSYSGANWQAKLNSVGGTSATNTIVIKAQNSGTVTITADGNSTDNYIIAISNTDYVTIQDLTLINSASDYGRVIDISGTSSNCVIKGCNLSTSTSGSASSDDRAVVCVGRSGAPFGGSNVVIQNNAITNGYAGVIMYGTSTTSLTEDNSITGNTIANPYKYFIYAAFAENVNIAGNVATGTMSTLTHGVYLDYIQGGGTVSGNDITISTTSGTHYGIYNNYSNNVDQAAPLNLNNNTVEVKVSSGVAHSLYNYYCYNTHISGNTFSAEATSSGNAHPPTLMYYCNNSTAENNVFNAKATSGGIAKGTYNFMSYANACNVRANTFNISSTTGKICSEKYYFMYYAKNSHCDNNVFNYTSTTGGIFNQTSSSYNYALMCYADNASFDSNKVNLTSTKGVIGHGTNSTSALNSWNYAGTISYRHNKIVINSQFTGTSYGIYGYYAGYYAPGNLTFTNDTFEVTRTSSATHYLFGYYFSYTSGPANKTIKFNNNVINATISGGSFYAMPYILCYQSNFPELRNNNISVQTTSGSVYAFGYYALYYTTQGGIIENNTATVNASSSATVYNPYYLMYNANKSAARNNTFTTNTKGSINLYSQGFGSGDTMENNTINATTTSGSINNYFSSYTTGITRNNTWNLNSTSGSIYNRNYYGNGGLIAFNTLNATTTSGSIYGIYEYNTSSSYPGITLTGNKFNNKSNTGTVYGFYMAYYSRGLKLFSNVITNKTAGTSVLYQDTYTGNYNDVLVFNNTFHSNGTHSTNNRLVYITGGTTSYKGKTHMYNNIFSRANAASANAVEVKDTAYFKSDYNLLYSPGTVKMRMTADNITATTMEDWKAGSGQDMNSLVYDPGFMDAANGDLRPDPANPNSWAVQGRGLHIEKDTIDALGTLRAKDRFEGVPDLGAYEFTPTATPPAATAVPSNPVANTRQIFYFGGDSVCSIDWGNTVPSSVAVRQYTGLKANVTPGITERAFFYVDVQTPLGVYEYKPRINYKNGWIGNVSNETNFRIAKSSNGGAWAGYNYHKGITDSINNALMPADDFDSLSSKFTGVENARIGIRCLVPPMGLQHYDVTAFDAKETWEPVFVPTGYEIIIDTVVSPLNLSLKQFVSPPPSGSPVYPIQNLTENTTYYVNVRTICGAKDTSSWSVDSFRTMITCHAPTIGVTSITHKQAVIFWDTVQTAIKYEYVINETPGAPTHGTIINSTSYLAYGLKAGTKYYAHVKSYCGTIYDESAWSEIEFTTLWPASVEELDGSASITAYPNPVKDVVTVNMFNKPAQGAVVNITDLAGKTVYTTPVNESKFEINMSRLPSGMYMLKYSDSERSEVIKITKE